MHALRFFLRTFLPVEQKEKQKKKKTISGIIIVSQTVWKRIPRLGKFLSREKWRKSHFENLHTSSLLLLSSLVSADFYFDECAIIFFRIYHQDRNIIIAGQRGIGCKGWQEQENLLSTSHKCRKEDKIAADDPAFGDQSWRSKVQKRLERIINHATRVTRNWKWTSEFERPRRGRSPFLSFLETLNKRRYKSRALIFSR